MKILLDDGMQISRGTGIGKYSASLYSAFCRRSDVEIELFDIEKFSQEDHISRVDYLRAINSSEFARFADQFDLVIFTNYVMPYRKLRAKVVVVVHDLVAFDYPETLPLAYCIYNRVSIKHAMKNADYVCTVSQTMAERICSKFRRVKAKVVFAWPGLVGNIKPIDGVATFDDSELANVVGDQFFLFVSTVEKRKNVEQVIRAFAALKASCFAAGDYKLVIVGRPGYGYSNIVALVRDLDMEDSIVFTGYVSDNDCNLLYNRAQAFVFPSSYEGFGFAQLECMACHLPIILSDIPVNREISRGYGLFFDLSSDDSLMRQMKKVVDGEIDIKRMQALADSYLADFSWDHLSALIINEVMGFEDCSKCTRVDPGDDTGQ